MSIAAKSPHQQDTVSAATVSFLGELALLPAIQQGDIDSVAELVSERAVKLVDARYISIWMHRTACSTFLLSAGVYQEARHQKHPGSGNPLLPQVFGA